MRIGKYVEFNSILQNGIHTALHCGAYLNIPINYFFLIFFFI